MNDKSEIYSKVVRVLEELFEIDADKITLESNLYSDLDVDSIDAVDLVVELKKMTGKKIKPEDFKNVRTVGDIVDAVADVMNS